MAAITKVQSLVRPINSILIGKKNVFYGVNVFPQYVNYSLSSRNLNDNDLTARNWQHQFHGTENQGDGRKSSFPNITFGGIGALSLALVGAVYYLKQNKLKCEVQKNEWTATLKPGSRRPDEVQRAATLKPGSRRPDMPDYRHDEIKLHSTPKNRIWVTFDHGVYDITDFYENHPGGKNKILLAAGGQLEPFWEMYAVHKNEDVYEILEELRIGNVHPEDKKLMKVAKSDDPYKDDPRRHPALKVNSAKPFNAETPVQLLADNFITPNELFFVRNHLPVPLVDEKKFKLEVCSPNLKKSVSFQVENLKKNFPIHTITAAVQCAGNRRSEMGKSKPVKGLNWSSCAISNAEWTGVKLSDVLQHLGVKDEPGYHVIFQGLDKDIESTPYEASIPIETAMDPRREVLLAFAMNGKPLPLDHGFPLRVVVPGSAGARQVKWLSKIVVSPTESSSHWQQNDYKTFNPSTDWDTVDFSKAVAIQDYPIQSSICEPADGEVLESSEEVTVKGYAWSGGGRGIIRVEVSIDDGKTWHEAKLHTSSQRLHRQWAWTLWDLTLPIKDQKGKLSVKCKAIDSSHNQQPEKAESIWNLRGLIHNAWHHIEVNIPE